MLIKTEIIIQCNAKVSKMLHSFNLLSINVNTWMDLCFVGAKNQFFSLWNVKM